MAQPNPPEPKEEHEMGIPDQDLRCEQRDIPFMGVAGMRLEKGCGSDGKLRGTDKTVPVRCPECRAVQREPVTAFCFNCGCLMVEKPPVNNPPK